MHCRWASSERALHKLLLSAIYLAPREREYPQNASSLEVCCRGRRQAVHHYGPLAASALMRVSELGCYSSDPDADAAAIPSLGMGPWEEAEEILQRILWKEGRARGCCCCCCCCCH